MLVHIITDLSYRARNILHPIHVFSKQLKQLDITIKIQYKPNKSLFSGDVLCIINHYFRPKRFNRNPPKNIEFLEWARSKAKSIIYFDTNDSSGLTNFDVLPFVDLYAKCELLKDRSLYSKIFYGNRIYTGYYHNTLDIVDDKNHWVQAQMKPNDQQKIALLWNLGLGDYRTFSKWGRRLLLFSPLSNYSIRPVTNNLLKNIDIFYRGRAPTLLGCTNYQRYETNRQLSTLAENSNYNIVFQGVVPYRQYKNEISRSHIVISPFGGGEVCYRDFESFIAGAALLKPDMSHLETWPDYYEPGVTYMPFAWDFSDFEEKVLDLLESPEKRQCIAQAGQERYLHSLSPVGGEEFAEHFAALIQKAIANS
jgi:hypothetical protein